MSNKLEGRTYKDGTRAGDPILGSRLYRGFCPRCETAIRVTDQSKAADNAVFCEDCAGDSPIPRSCVDISDLISITNNRDIRVLPAGLRRLTPAASVRFALIEGSGEV